MKKYLLVAALMLVAAAVEAKTSFRNIPEGPNDGLATAEYGGVTVDVSTIGELASDVRNPFDGPGVIHNVNFSTGACKEFVDLYDSSSTVAATYGLNWKARIYNVAGSTAGSINNSCTGEVALKYPIQLQRGLVWDPSVGTFNTIGVGYTRH